MNPSLELIYLQDKYLKFSKTGGNNTSLRLPGLPLTSATDVTIEFDHASMVQASGTVDDAKVVVVIEGDGQFENGTKYSDVLKIDQPKGTYCWTHSSARIKVLPPAPDLWLSCTVSLRRTTTVATPVNITTRLAALVESSSTTSRYPSNLYRAVIIKKRFWN